ncbi:MAG: GGDEF domain-containing protein, partial [Actinomycetota bacterium]|nr:GGDEF domain-containing protein [Actinomycetota bacterium]
MKPEPLDTSEVPTAKSASLERVLRRSQKIRGVIKQAAGRLASATVVLKRGKRANSPTHTVERAITEYEKVEGEVATAAHDLTQVNTDLAVEVAERVGIESELADTKADLADMKVDLATARDDLSESQANEDEALQRSLHDPLTGLPNRALFDQGLDHGLIQARRHGWGLAVLFIDLDDFKSINDSYGHHVGDEVLLMIADRLRSFVRAEDMVSRWGGDEFVCLLLEVGEQADVTRLAQGMIDRIAEEFESGGTTLSLRCSIGIAVYPGDGESADVLLKNADEAMYRAKGTPEKVVLFGSEPPQGTGGR